MDFLQGMIKLNLTLKDYVSYISYNIKFFTFISFTISWEIYHENHIGYNSSIIKDCFKCLWYETYSTFDSQEIPQHHSFPSQSVVWVKEILNKSNFIKLSLHGSGLMNYGVRK